jgi:hypothetical protein
MFPTFGFLAQQILGVIGSQIEIEITFSLVGILTNLKRCHLQIDNLKKLTSVNKNWLNDPIIGCKFPSNLMEYLGKDVDLEEELKELEGEFERDEVVEV